MDLKAYLARDDALSVAKLRERTGVKSDAQIRQWQHGYHSTNGVPRIPSPENCVALERATGGLVRRWDLRPEDWHRIWPELIGADGAPAVPEPASAA